MSSDSSHITSKFTTRIEREGERYLIEVPAQEFDYGTLSEGDICRITIEVVESGPNEDGERTQNEEPNAPVSIGDNRTVEIESIGDEGDGIARVDQGYVVIVPETEPGDKVEIEITDVTPNVGFAEVVDKSNTTANATKRSE